MNLTPGSQRGVGADLDPSLGPATVDAEQVFDGDDITPWRREIWDPNDYEQNQDLPDPDGWSFDDE